MSCGITLGRTLPTLGTCLPMWRNTLKTKRNNRMISHQVASSVFHLQVNQKHVLAPLAYYHAFTMK